MTERSRPDTVFRAAPSQSTSAEKDNADLTADILEFLRACYGDLTGQAHAATGRRPYLSEAGKYRHKDWRENHCGWPGDAELLARALAEAAAEADAYVCPYLMWADKRTPGGVVARILVHADVDSGHADPEEVRDLGGFALASGTPGNAHVFVPLTEPIPAYQHKAVADVVALRGKVGALNLLDDRRRSQWATRLRDLGCDYLVLDCLRPVLDVLGLDENRDAGKFLVAYDDEAGIGDSPLVQHMGHANERARGDSRLQDWPDAIWRIVRETDEPGSPRYFSAYGRDVEVTEGRLSFNQSTRRMTYAAGSRTDAKVEAASSAVIKLLAESAGEAMSKNAIETALRGGDHPQKAIRAAIDKLLKRGWLREQKGAKGAKLHSIAYPCSECGLPVTSQRQRHESCPSGPEGLFE